MKRIKFLFASILVIIVAAVFTAPVYGAVNISKPAVNDWWVVTEGTGDYIKNLDGKNQVYGDGGDLWRNVEVYSDLAIDPDNSLNMFEFHIQDRWSNGCGMELGLVRSDNGGLSWYNYNEVPGGLQIVQPLWGDNDFRGEFIRPSNPWLGWSADGKYLLANYITMQFPWGAAEWGGWAVNAVSMFDNKGVETWSDPILILREHIPPSYVTRGVGPYSDYQTITFDPIVKNNVYSAWMRIQEEPGVKPLGPLSFSKSTDYGETWSNPKIVYAPGASPIGGAGHGNCWIGNILVNPVTGTLLLFTSRSWDNYEDIAVLRSEDGGKKWSKKPITVHETPLTYYYDQDGSKIGDFGTQFPYTATEKNPVDNPGDGDCTGRRWRNNAERMHVAALPIGDEGVLYCVFQSRTLRDDPNDKRPVCALARSVNDGKDWEVIRIDKAGDDAIATMPRVAAAGNKVGVTYWDTVDDIGGDAELKITYRLVVYTEDNGIDVNDFEIKRIPEFEIPFVSNDLRSAPIVSRSFFIGEHMGLQAIKEGSHVYFHTTFPQIYDVGPAEDEVPYFDGDTIRIYDENRIDMFYEMAGPY